MAMEWYSSKFFTGGTINDNHPSMNADPTGHSGEKVMIAMCAEPSFVLLWDRYKIFHREFSR
jgi:hypothetical protein